MGEDNASALYQFSNLYKLQWNQTVVSDKWSETDNQHKKMR